MNAMSKPKTSSVSTPKVAASNLVTKLVSSQGQSRSEGHSIPFGAADAKGRVGLDVSKAPIPSRRYVTELCTVLYDGRDCTIIFAQKAIFGDELETALAIRLTKTSIVQFTDSVAEMSKPTLTDIVGIMNLTAESLSDITSRPTQTVKVVANLIATAIAGQETCMDFYHASPFAMRKSERQATLEVEPVVRVDISTALFVSLVARIREIAAEIALSQS